MKDQRKFDVTRPAFFRGYGKETRVVPHPCLGEKWSSTMRETYLKPNTRTKAVAHTKFPVGEQEFDNALEESKRRSTIASGFENNAQL